MTNILKNNCILKLDIEQDNISHALAMDASSDPQPTHTNENRMDANLNMNQNRKVTSHNDISLDVPLKVSRWL